jgi:hypothetical protein
VFGLIPTKNGQESSALIDVLALTESQKGHKKQTRTGCCNNQQLPHPKQTWGIH